jgi:hypothetical protein
MALHNSPSPPSEAAPQFSTTDICVRDQSGFKLVKSQRRVRETQAFSARGQTAAGSLEAGLELQFRAHEESSFQRFIPVKGNKDGNHYR